MDKYLHWLKIRVFRNEYSIKDVPSNKKRVNIEHSKLLNVGDTISPLIVRWMVENKGIDPDRRVGKTKHLMAVGSVIGRGRFDVTLWGPGILKETTVKMIAHKLKRGVKYDIRAVRGPETRKRLMGVGCDCPEVYGDPAILMPMIYQPENVEKKYDVSLILHHRTEGSAQGSSNEAEYQINIPEGIHIIDPKTADYKFFIDELVASKRIISSSLHGIILAETYGIPCVFLKWGIKDQLIKFDDWFFSTNRPHYETADSVEQALQMESLELPDLEGLRLSLINCFPYDLWES